jgi:hypothetical protein
MYQMIPQRLLQSAEVGSDVGSATVAMIPAVVAAAVRVVSSISQSIHALLLMAHKSGVIRAI